MCRTVAGRGAADRRHRGAPLGIWRPRHRIEGFRLRGVRIGVMPLTKGTHPGTTRLFADAAPSWSGEDAVRHGPQNSGSLFDEDGRA